MTGWIDSNSHNAPVISRQLETAKITLVYACAKCVVAVAKMAALLLQEFNDSEISNLPPTFQNKLEGILTGLQYEIDSLKAQHEQFRVDSGKSFLINVSAHLVSGRFY